MKCVNCGEPVSEEKGYYIKSDGTVLCWNCALKDDDYGTHGKRWLWG